MCGKGWQGVGKEKGRQKGYKIILYYIIYYIIYIYSSKHFAFSCKKRCDFLRLFENFHLLC